MKIVTLDPKKFDEYSKKHKNRNYYQTSNYGNVMIKFGYNVHYLGILDENNTLIGATLLLYKEVFMGNKIAYAPRGILFDYENKEQTLALAEKLKNILGKQGFMLLRMDPYIISTIRDSKGNIINFNNQTNIIQSNLTSSNFIFKGKTQFFENTKPRWEAIKILNKDSEDLFKELEKRTKYKINKAISSGIEIKIAEENNVDSIYNFIKNKQHRSKKYYEELVKNFNGKVYTAVINTEKFVVNSRESYEKETYNNNELTQKIQNENLNEATKQKYINTKMESDKLITTYKDNMILATKLLKENPKGLIIGGAITIEYDNATYLIIEGLNKTYSSLNSNYLLKWQIICDANKSNQKYVNLNGVVGEFEKENKYSGLNEMKLSYNANVLEYIGEYDIILNNFAYKLYKNIKKGK